MIEMDSKMAAMKAENLAPKMAMQKRLVLNLADELET